LFKSLIIVLLADHGPQPLFKIDSSNEDDLNLSEAEIMKLGISGLTAIGLGVGIQVARNRLHGSFPVHERNDIAALVYPFNVKAGDTIDNRVEHFGREVLIFLIFEINNRDTIFRNYGAIERKIASTIIDIKREQEIEKTKFSHLLSEINEQFDQLTTGIKDISYDPKRITQMGEEMVYLQEIIDLKLKSQGNPFLASNGYALCTFEDFCGNEEDAEKYYDLIRDLIELDYTFVLENTKHETLFKIGNYYYTVARKSADKSVASFHLERALKFYKLACKLRDEAMYRISIGAVLFKRSREELAKENIKIGISMLQELGFDEGLLNEKEIYTRKI